MARVAGWAPLAASALSVACSSSPSPSPDVFVASSVGPSADNPHVCSYPSPTPWLVVGTPVSGKPVTVQTGGTNGSGNVAVQCVVHPVGKGFDISLSASIDGPQGASLTITSPGGKGAVTTSTTSGISATFGGPKGDYKASNCTLSYEYSMSSVPINPPIAAGRVFAHISCPQAQSLGSQMMTADGGVFTDTCDAEADFLFEQCDQ